MNDRAKTKEQLVREMKEMPQRVAVLEASEVKRKQAEKTLSLPAEYYQYLFELFPIGVTILDMKGVILFCNSAVYNKGGYPEGEFIGKHFSKISSIRVKDIPKFIRVFNSIVRGRIPKPFEAIYQYKDGTIGWTELNISLLKIGGKRRILVIQHDITGRKQAEEALRESEERFRTLTENTSDWIWEVDVNGVYTYASPKISDLLGYKPGEVIGKTPFDFMPPKESKRIAREFYANVESRRPFAGLENTNLHRDGRLVVLETSGIPFYDADSQFCGYRGIDRDITERKETGAELMAYQKELRSLASQLSLSEERERRRISMALHDRIGQTLAICRMRLGALVKSAPTDYFVQPVGEINTLINQIIKETRSLIFEISSPLLYGLGLEAALERLTEQLQEQHGILFSFEDDEQPKPLDDDLVVLLFQTVRELLVNITKHAQARYTRVCIKRDDNNIRITVEDDGVGFDTSKTSSSRKRTSGFGLFSIQERMHYIGGHIEIESKLGHGTLVTIVVPLKRE
ncbi:PAS domain S-box protein [Chloroflexota bacterium]